jgi:hypothetical protein
MKKRLGLGLIIVGALIAVSAIQMLVSLIVLASSGYGFARGGEPMMYLVYILPTPISLAMIYFGWRLSKEKPSVSSEPSAAKESANLGPTAATKILAVVGLLFGASLALGSLTGFLVAGVDSAAAILAFVQLVAGAGIIFLVIRKLPGRKTLASDLIDLAATIRPTSMKEMWAYAKTGLFKRGMNLMLVGGALVVSPLLLAFISSLQSRDIYSGSAALWLIMFTLPAGGITAIVGLVQLASQPNSLLGRRLLFTLNLFFGFLWLFVGLGLLAIGYPGSDIYSQGFGSLLTSVFSFLLMALAFVLLFRREAKGLPPQP